LAYANGYKNIAPNGVFQKPLCYFIYFALLILKK
jgi:hypothetical protein